MSSILSQIDQNQQSSASIFTDSSNAPETQAGSTHSMYQNWPGGSDLSSPDAFRGLLERDEIGFSPKLRELWKQRDAYDANTFTAAIRNELDKTFIKVIEGYKRESVDEADLIPYILQLDIDLIEDIRIAMRDKSDMPYALSFISTIEQFCTLITTGKHPNSDGILIGKIEISVNQYRPQFKGDITSMDEFMTKTNETLDWFKNSLTQDMSPRRITVNALRTLTKENVFHLVDSALERGEKVFRINCEWSWFVSDKNNNGAYTQILVDTVKHVQKNGMHLILGTHHFTYPTGIGEPHANYFIDNYQTYVNKLLTILDENGVLSLENPIDLILFNEPMAMIPQGYGSGAWPPFQKGNIINLFKAFRNVAKAYEQTYLSIKDNSNYEGKLKIGFSENLPVMLPRNPNNIIDRATANIYTKLGSIWLDEIIKRSNKAGRLLFDFVALQSYGGHAVNLLHSPSANPGEREPENKFYETMSNGWVFSPESLTSFLIKLNSKITNLANEIGSLNSVPILVSEYGVASMTDPTAKLSVLFQAIQLASSLIKGGVPYALRWSPGFSTVEWRMLLSHFSAFGDTTYFGKRKPNNTAVEAKLNYESDFILGAVAEYNATLRDRVRFLARRQAELTEQIDLNGNASDLGLVQNELELNTEIIRRQELYLLFFGRNSLNDLQKAVTNYELNSQDSKHNHGTIRSKEEYAAARLRLHELGIVIEA